MSEFNIGDTVVVTESGCTHNAAEKWIAKTQFNHLWKIGTTPLNGSIGEVVHVMDDINFVKIGEVVYMINDRGIALKEEEMPNYRPDSVSFREIRLKYVELFSDQFFSIDLFGQHTEVNYGTEYFQCSSEQDLFQILDALTVLAKFKVQL